jgi:hypothetical protein
MSAKPVLDYITPDSIQALHERICELTSCCAGNCASSSTTPPLTCYCKNAGASSYSMVA